MRVHTISTALASETQQSYCHHTRGRARENRQPWKFPSLLRSHWHERWLAPGLGPGEKPQEHQCFRGSASTASRAPHWRGDPSAMTSSLRASCALQREAMPCENPGASTSCTVMAVNIDGAASSAEAPCKGKGESKAAGQKHTKQLGINAGQFVRRNSRQSSACTTPTLRSHEGFHWGTNTTNSRNSRSTREAASCCHPDLMASISNSSKF